MSNELIDMIGQRFGWTKVVSRAPNQGASVAWNCQCACGTMHVASGSNLRTGHSKSCGCKKHSIQKMNYRPYLPKVFESSVILDDFDE